MKKCLNLKNNLNKTKIDIGKSIKAYEKTGNYILEKAEWASYHFQGVTGRC